MKFQHNLQFLLFLLFAYLLSHVPYFRIPAEWFGTLFHELSHGMAALLTGGIPIKLNLHIDGSGTMWSSGGFQFIIAFAGYTGATIWGLLIYLMASCAGNRTGIMIAHGLSILCIVIIIFLASWHDATVPILLFISGSFFVTTKSIARKMAVPILKTVGCYIMVSGFFAPMVLFQSLSGDNDAKTLTQLTGIPETFWIISWLLIGILSIIVGIYLDRKIQRRIYPPAGSR